MTKAQQLGIKDFPYEELDEVGRIIYKCKIILNYV